MPQQLDPVDHSLLNVMQTEIPLVDRPFAVIGECIGTDEADVLRRLTLLRSPPRPLIRQISAIFDSKSLGYQSTLVAAQVEESKLEAAAAVINRHPGVSHNYWRNHAFNLWYTLAVPPDSALGLEKTLEILHRQSQASSTRMLPTLRLFKIGVKFDLSGEADLDARSQSANVAQKTETAAPVTESQKRLIRILQQDLPLVPEPFAQWAEQGGVETEALLAGARNFLAQGLMRRFAAVLRHREAGISANAMGVWAVSAGQEETFGQAASRFNAVSHCYLRKSYPDWPYTIFTMVHAPTREQCEEVLAKISQETGVRDYAALYSTKEYKKTRVKYFTDDAAAWERE